MSYPKYSNMSYPNNLTYPQAKAGLYAGSNCFIPIYVNKNPRPYIPVPSLGELLCFQQVPDLCKPIQYSQKCSDYVENPPKGYCLQNGTGHKCNV